MTTSKTPPIFKIGQCWTSEGEPELGIGFVKALDATSVAIEYPTATAGRLYRIKTPPLRRLEFRVGEKVQSKAGTTLTIERIDVRDHLFWYVDEDGKELCESELSPKLTLQRPMERFLAGHWDPLKAFSLRRQTLEFYHRHLSSRARGMIGPRIQLLPHQAFVTQEISKRGLPRALLADEVGLGKTIEAAWIMHRLLSTQRIRRVLIIVPESLVNQWFVELFKRFNLSFWVPASQSEEELEESDIGDQERVILSLESIAELHGKGFLKAEDWDLVIVDEAHRVAWTQNASSPEYQVIEELAAKTAGLLLLTATPEQLGLEGHYSRLHLIDAERFSSFQAFEKEHEAYLSVVKLADLLISKNSLTAKEIASLEKKLQGLIPSEVMESLKAQSDQESVSVQRRIAALALIDHFGTGRIYFRNARSVVAQSAYTFPKRKLKRHPLKVDLAQKSSDCLTLWLAEFAAEHRKEKSLLICSSAKQVIEWEKRLRDDYALKVVGFHEQLSLLARDRNAAYFEDPSGASLLLCSEIGGEGRNFQHASHLILADLPEDPDVLEQRIGRLDRIGQRSDIAIHVPYLEKSQTERLLRWHDEVFHAFDSPPQGAHAVFEQFNEELRSFQDKKFTKATVDSFQKLILQASEAYQLQLEKIEAGRDKLIEINSFDPVEAPRLAQALQAAEKPELLKTFFEDLLDAMGLHSDDLDPDSLFIDPGHGQYVSYFPGLPPDGLSVTFSREKALKRNDLTLITWDHPMVNETLEQVIGQEFGNVSVASWAKQLLIAECSFVFEPAGVDSKWFADEFFPSAPLRIMIEATGRDLTTQLEWEALSKALKPITPTATAFVKRLPGEKIRGMLNKAGAQARGLSQPIKAQAIAKMNAAIDEEISRLKVFQAKNKLVNEQELLWWAERKAQLTRAFSGAQVRLDSFLLVVPDQWGQ